ncbi:polysaccharide biosynthesis/export family protein [Carboxylicivirga taeanensis]|uniref:polysaccharide biosynthesis/export family protein n=1 Tax=Carboxylicivirga taeanensis TaxID=1416875 RepID=UPI003F6DBF98
MANKQVVYSIIKLFCLGILLNLTSCIPHKKVSYFKELEDHTSFNLEIPEAQKRLIQYGDRLIIEVLSVNERVNSIFRGTSSQDVNYTTYIVDDYGKVNFPFIGSIEVYGLSQEEAGKKIESELMEYLNQLVVKVRIQSNLVSLVGELRTPGMYEFSEDKIELLRAIALAGGVSDFGKKDEVHILRRTGNELKTLTVDLTEPDYFNGEEYFVYPNDIIVINAVKQKNRQLSSLNWTTILALLTTSITVYYFITNLNE